MAFSDISAFASKVSPRKRPKRDTAKILTIDGYLCLLLTRTFCQAAKQLYLLGTGWW